MIRSEKDERREGRGARGLRWESNNWGGNVLDSER
jgi:hypothetical protein